MTLIMMMIGDFKSGSHCMTLYLLWCTLNQAKKAQKKHQDAQQTWPASQIKKENKTQIQHRICCYW